MSDTVTLNHECKSCGGTGLYVGMAERDGAAIVCHTCKGKGWSEYTYTPFAGRKHNTAAKRVFEANPGFCIGEGKGFSLEDFGGIPVEDWMDGKPFPHGSEMRHFCCPGWWAQCSSSPAVNWTECISVLGKSFRECWMFGLKHKCWERYDKERL